VYLALILALALMTVLDLLPSLLWSMDIALFDQWSMVIELGLLVETNDNEGCAVVRFAVVADDKLLVSVVAVTGVAVVVATVADVTAVLMVVGLAVELVVVVDVVVVDGVVVLIVVVVVVGVVVVVVVVVVLVEVVVVSATHTTRRYVLHLVKTIMYNNNNNNNNNNNIVICKAHKVSSNAESEAPAVAWWAALVGYAKKAKVSYLHFCQTEKTEKTRKKVQIHKSPVTPRVVKFG